MMIGIFLFLLGLIVGSFINALQYRIQIGQKNTGRSYCPKCKHTLAWYDLIPVISWVMLSGKCRYCQKKISAQYPVIELITALTFISLSLASGLSPKINEAIFGFQVIDSALFIKYIILLILLLIIASLFILLALHDAKTSYILSYYAYAGGLLSLAYHLVGYAGEWQIASLYHYLLPYILSGAIPALFFLSLYLISKGKWMGSGDSEVALFIGIFLGSTLTLSALYFAFIVGAVYGLIAIVLKKSKMKSALPFGPFLIAGCFFAFIFGNYVVNYYLRFMGL